jgi:hypothetical protein
MHRPPRSVVAFLAAIACAGAASATASAAPSDRGDQQSQATAAQTSPPETSNRPAGAGSGRKIG